MTVIAACLTDSQVAIGGDSGAFDESSGLKMVSADPKVFKIGPWLVGVAGSFRVINIVSRATDGSPEKIRDFLHKELTGDPGAWSVLFASASGIYELSEDFSLIRYRDNYAAVGAGSEMATGALAVLRAHTDLEARDIVKMALDATALHSTMALPPFKIYNYIF